MLIECVEASRDPLLLPVACVRLPASGAIAKVAESLAGALMFSTDSESLGTSPGLTVGISGLAAGAASETAGFAAGAVLTRGVVLATGAASATLGLIDNLSGLIDDAASETSGLAAGAVLTAGVVLATGAASATLGLIDNLSGLIEGTASAADAGFGNDPATDDAAGDGFGGEEVSSATALFSAIARSA